MEAEVTLVTVISHTWIITYEELILLLADFKRRITENE
jgi:hypothetical protein